MKLLGKAALGATSSPGDLLAGNWHERPSREEARRWRNGMRVLLERGEVLRELTSRISRSSQFSLGTALISQSGLDLVCASIEDCLNRGGKGQLLFGVDLPSEPAAIRRLSEIQKNHKENFILRRFEPGRTFFHPKISIFVAKKKTAILGSSNLTAGGLDTNYETNILIDQPRVVNQLLDYFNEHFLGAHSKPVDHRWLSDYEQLWKKRKQIEHQQRKLREKARNLGRPPANVPKQIKGHAFAFTGAIAGWPRERKLYPRIERLGGIVARKAGGMGSADYRGPVF
jgi:HKD family nuclease